jgi:hypothetical protein
MKCQWEKKSLLLRLVQVAKVSARPRYTADGDNGDGDGDDDKDPTTLTSATADTLCETFFTEAEIALTVDDVVSSILNFLDSLTPCSPRPSTSRSRCNLQPSVLDTIILWIFLLWYRRIPKPELGKHHEHPRRQERGRQYQGGRFCDELAVASKVAGT